MAQFANMFEVDLNNRSYPVSLVQTVSEGNVNSNRIGAYVYKDGAPVNLGGACTGLVMRADGTTVPMTGVIDGNAAYVVLNQESCAIPGPIQVAVSWVSGNNTTTLLVAYGTVITTDTRNYVQSGPIADVNTLLGYIGDVEQAAADAAASAASAAESAVTAQNRCIRFDATQSLTDAQKSTARDNIGAVYKEMTFAHSVEHDLFVGKAYDATHEEETAGNYTYIKCDVASSDSQLIVTGYNYGSNWPLCVFLKSNGHVKSFVQGLGGYNQNVLVTVPSETSAIIVNGAYDQITYPSSVYRLDNYALMDSISIIDNEITMLTSYSTPDNVLNVSGYAFDVNTLDETQGSFCYSKYILNGEKRIFATGTHFGEEWPGVVFLDENNTVLEAVIPYSKYFVTTDHFELMPVDVPDGAYCVVVNGRNETANDPYRGAYVYVETPLYNVKEEIETGINANNMFRLKKVEYAQVNGYAYDAFDNVETAGSFSYSKYELQGESVIYVSGTHYGPRWPLINYIDENDGLICSQWGKAETYQSCVRSVVPSNAKYVIVNGSPSTGGATIYKVDRSTPSMVERLGSCESAIDSLINTGTVRKYLFIGDSYGAGWSHDDLNDGWPTYTVQNMHIANEQYILSSVGGAGFAGGGFLNQINSISSDIGITDVVICGGFNDVYASTDTITAGIQNVVNAVKTKWPAAVIHIGFIGYIKAGSGAGALADWEAKRTKLVTEVLPCYRNSIKLGCRYLNNVEYWLGESGLTPSDGYHPNEAGNRSIALAVANALYTGSAPLPYSQSLRID
jgi:lysophospholipase L1-like esterase